MSSLSPLAHSFEQQQAYYAAKGIAVDVFGEPLREPEHASAPAVTIALTPDVLAAEEARREAREVRREGITWRMPEPAPAPLYHLPAGRSRGQHRSSKSKSRKGTTPRIAQEKEPMKDQPETSEATARLCAVQSCDKAIGGSNKSGRCTKHWFVKQGTSMRDGSIWSGSSSAKPAKTKGQNAKPTKPAKAALVGQHPLVQAVAGTGVVLLPVPERSLDAFWLRLTVNDKVRIVAAEMQR